MHDSRLPSLFIVGDPFNMDGTKSDFQKRISKFSSELNKRYDVRVHMMDERLTTKEAKERIKHENNGIKGSSNKHSISAQIILEDWFRSAC